MINTLTGNLDRPGGAISPARPPPVRGRRRPYAEGTLAQPGARMPEVNGELPVATLADEIETPGEGQVHALITLAGNPVLSAPNGDRLDAAFANLDFMVSVDRYLNETTRHADVVLPPPRTLASPHYDFALLGFAVRNYARFSPPVLPRGDRPAESEILERLTMIAAGQQGDPGGIDELVIAQTLGQAVAQEGSAVAGRDVAQLRAELDGDIGGERRLRHDAATGPVRRVERRHAALADAAGQSARRRSRRI